MIAWSFFLLFGCLAWNVHECISMIHLKCISMGKLVGESERVCICLCKYMRVWLYVRYVPLWNLESLSHQTFLISSKQCGKRPIRNTVIHRVHGISQFSLYKSTEALSKADHVNEHRVDLTLVVVTKTVEKYSSVQQKPKISMKHPSL